MQIILQIKKYKYSKFPISVKRSVEVNNTSNTNKVRFNGVCIGLYYFQTQSSLYSLAMAFAVLPLNGKKAGLHYENILEKFLSFISRSKEVIKGENITLNLNITHIYIT